jgi:hypothetical protein
MRNRPGAQPDSLYVLSCAAAQLRRPSVSSCKRRIGMTAPIAVLNRKGGVGKTSVTKDLRMRWRRADSACCR